MPGRFGTTNNEDGVIASTKASDHVGVFGSNESTAPPAGGGAGGAGVFGLTVSPGASGVFGANNSTKGVGVQGNGPEAGVSGFSEQGAGVRAHSSHANAVEGFAHDANGTAMLAINNATTAPTINDGSPRGSGVLGVTTVPGASGVLGANNSAKGVGVQGNGPEAGISGFSEQGAGVRAHSNHANAVEGFAHDANGTAMLAINNATTAPTINDGSPRGSGVLGVTTVPGASGVFGANNSAKGAGVHGNGPEVGVGGFSEGGKGVLAQSKTGIGILAQGGGLAGRFEGNVHVTGNLTSDGDIFLSHADCAEDFDIFEADTIEPGTVMSFHEDGSLQQSQYAYDKRVVGVVSGAGNYKPGIILDKQQERMNRKPVALMGKVYCKVDADYAPVEIGDLLTTSATPGHAMKATDPFKAFGTVIGKAMHPLKEGKGLIPILVALQ
ncbi:hypothetical protein [Ectobacillus panaciterrae]|uniref:hypothetical protein n=1 Tax=Ectobacillus panaciterrae TaxID=363872 RepID=UPI00040D9959|nr:hypothetical protein [Ectobacillus panaciterrae]